MTAQILPFPSDELALALVGVCLAFRHESKTPLPPSAFAVAILSPNGQFRDALVEASGIKPPSSRVWSRVAELLRAMPEDA